MPDSLLGDSESGPVRDVEAECQARQDAVASKATTPAKIRAAKHRRSFGKGYAKAIKDVLWHLRYVDWQEDTAADAVEAKFGDHPHVRGER